jgi:hypothetical protein
MLDMGFVHDVKKLLKLYLPSVRPCFSQRRWLPLYRLSLIVCSVIRSR